MVYNQLSLYNTGRLRCIADLIPSASSFAYALDVGCGTGIWNAQMCKIVKSKGYMYIGLDISKEFLLKDKNLTMNAYILSDACSLPSKPCFKLVIALEIIEHLDNPEKLLAEISGILAKGGYLIISTPNKFSLEGIWGKTREFFGSKKWVAWDEEHKHIFSSIQFLAILKKYFSVVQVLGYYLLLSPPFLEKATSMLKTHYRPLNKLGFQTIGLLKKVG